MPAVPNSPGEFFQDYLPAEIGKLAGNLPRASSPGAVVFHVGGQPPFALELRDGALVVERRVPDTTLLQIAITEADFGPVVLQGAERLAGESTEAHRLALLRALTLDPEQAGLLRPAAGRVAFLLQDGAEERRVVLQPGATPLDPSAAECTVRASLENFLALQSGAANPFDLMMQGSIQISGDAALVMALSGLFT